MKKRIAILGSTGSIGKCLIDIIKQDKKWLKETTKDNIKKDLKNLKQLIDKVK